MKTSHLLATLLAAAITAAPAAAQSLPEGKIGINYNRCDGDYDGWGLHVWKQPNIPLPDVEWQKPMKPTGKNDFGVFWQMDFAEFGKSGTVNYIIHKGDTKEQGGQDMRFDGTKTKEVWVNGGDRRTFTSLDDAKKARAEKPC